MKRIADLRSAGETWAITTAVYYRVWVHNELMSIRIQRLATIVVVLAWAHVSSAQTADEVIEKSIAAMGGRAAMEKIKTRSMTGDILLTTPAGDIPGTVDITNAAPNKSRTVIKADLSAFGAGPLVIDQRFDGTSGYVLDTLQGNRDITGDQLANMKSNSFPHSFLNYKAMGTTVKLTGKEKVGAGEAFVLTFEPPAGSLVRQFVDVESYLPVKTVIKATLPQVGEIEQTAIASDFRELDGVKVPFKVQVTSPATGFTMTFSKITNNGAVDEKSFVKP